MITYRELRDKINTLPEEHLDDHVTVALNNDHGTEFFAATDFVGEKGEWPADDADREAMFVTEAEGVLDDGHPYLTLIE